jgi:hypothetical protein
VQAVADADPLGPAPPAEEGRVVEGEEGWGPVRIGSLPPAEPFPLDVLPAPARDLALAASASIACPVDYVAAACLTAASGAAGRSVILLVKSGYFATVALYLALVGGPSSGKSPALGAAMAPLRDLATLLYFSWRNAMAAWEAAEPAERGPMPVLVRLMTTDPTTEALAPILERNPRGVVVSPDEMTKWVLSMDQYKGGKGGDRPFYLSAWGGEPVIIDRAKNMGGPIVVPHPSVAVVGGMTPDMLSSLSEGQGREDGFTPRLLFCFPERAPKHYAEEGVPDDVAAAWHRLVKALWDRPMADSGGVPAPSVVRFSPEARAEWVAQCQAHYAEQDANDFPDSLEGPWGKLEAYAARLALLLHLMHLAADPASSPSAPLPDLPRRAVVDAFRLISYFKSHARRVYASMGRKSRLGGDVVRALVRWMVRNRLAEFSTRDVHRNFDKFKQDPDALAGALDWLKAHNAIREREVPDAGPRPGRKPSPSYLVNPDLLSSPRFQHF